MALQDFPTGTIIAWDNSAVPAGWLLCNGANGTPDLRDRFVYGASVDGDIGVTGGSDSHTHTSPNASTASAHDHGGSTDDNNVSGGGTQLVTIGSGGSAASDNHSHDFGMNVTSNGSHAHSIGASGSSSNVPQNVVRSFIRKT